MSGRIASGEPGLDAVVSGGLPAHGIYVLMGLPGTGKTILAQQYIFGNATPEAPAVYFTTVSEPFEKILRYGQTLSYFDTTAIGSRIVFADLGEALAQGGLAAALQRIDETVREKRPALICIDSFKALRPFADGEGELRTFLHGLAGRLSAFPVTSFWLGEYALDDVATAPEFAVADGVISLAGNGTAERSARYFEVLKLRGSSFMSGQHAYRLSSDGMRVFPRLADASSPAGYELDRARSSTGVPALDALLEDGYWAGSATLVAGPSGAGKTLLGLHFLFAGDAVGEPGIHATMQENPSQLSRVAASFGWSYEGSRVELMYRAPTDVYIDEWVYDLLAAVERIGAKRVFIDSLDDLQFSARDPIRFREYIYSLIQRFARAGVSVLIASELTELFRISRLSDFGVSHLADNVVILQYIHAGSELKRAITILKTRASRNDPRIHEFSITPDGFVLGDTFANEMTLFS